MKCIEKRSGLAGKRLCSGLAALALGAFLLAPVLCAEDASPARAVRLGSVDGQVQIFLNKQLATDQAVANMPLFEGTEVVTADDGRAEIQFEDGSVAGSRPTAPRADGLARAGRPVAMRRLRWRAGSATLSCRAQADRPSPCAFALATSVVTAGGFQYAAHQFGQSSGRAGGFLRQRAP